ncbi:hypothetical protein KCU95_g3032, partial [Aureobasidium melanogenum]
MAPKHSLDAAMGSSPTAKRARSTTTPTVKPTYRANFDRLCALHNWTPSEAVRDKLVTLLQLSGQRLKASELLPLAFVQHYPFIWVKDFLLLGYNDADESVWYKAFPTGRGMARGRYYNSAQVNILGKHTVTKFWQSWVDVFDIEQRGLDRCHEYFTGVYLILKKFPNLRYKAGKSKAEARDPQNAIRATGIAEYPFNDDHPFMQEANSTTNDSASDKIQQAFDVEKDIVDDEQNYASVIKQERTDLHDEDHAFLARRLLTQLTSRADLREFDSVSSPRSQGHTADDRQGSLINANGSASPLRRLSIQFNSCANLRHSMPMSVSHSPEHAMDKQSLGEDVTGVTSLPRQLSKQPVFRAYSCQLGSASLSSQFSNDKNITDKQADSYVKKDAPLFLADQPSRQSAFRTTPREIDSKSSSHATKPTSKTQVGPHIEDDISNFISQQSPRTPTSRVSSRTSKTVTSPYFARTRSQSTRQNILALPGCDSMPSQEFREYTFRVPVEAPRWSNTNFKFAVVVSTSTFPETPVTRSIEE